MVSLKPYGPFNQFLHIAVLHLNFSYLCQRLELESGMLSLKRMPNGRFFFDDLLIFLESTMMPWNRPRSSAQA